MEKTTKLELTSFSGINFDNIKTDIINLIKNNSKYNIYWDDYTSNDYTNLLIELAAWITDQLATRIDFSVNENFISTAQQKSSIIKLLNLIGYELKRPKAATIPVKCLALNEFPVGVSEIVLTEQFLQENSHLETEIYNNPYTITASGASGIIKTFELIPYEYDTNFERYRFRYGQKVSVDSSVYTSSKTLNFYEGTTIKETYTVPSDSGAKITLNSTSIIEDSVEVYLQNIVQDGDTYTYTEKELLQVRAFTTPEAQDQSSGIPYVLNTVENNGVEIEFASDFLLPSSNKRPTANSTIVVYYRIGGGIGGNISIGSINTQATIEDVIFSFINEEAGINGAEAESASEAVKYAPKTLKTVDKAVTEEDYNTILGRNSRTLVSRSYGSNSGVDNDTVLTKYRTLIKPFEVWNYIIPNREENVSKNTNDYENFEFFTKKNQEYLNFQGSYKEGSVNDDYNSNTPITFVQDVVFFEQEETIEPVTNKTNFYNYFNINPSDTFKNKILDADKEYVNGSFKLKIRELPTTENRISQIAAYTRTGNEDFSLNFDFDFDFIGNQNLVSEFTDGGVFRKTANVKALFKSKYNNSTYNLTTNNKIKFSINERGFIEVALSNGSSVLNTSIRDSINNSINLALGTLGTTDLGLSTAGYIKEYGYYNYPNSYSGLEEAPVKYSEVGYTTLTNNTVTNLEGNSNGFGTLTSQVYYFFYKKNGIAQTPVLVQFSIDDLKIGVNQYDFVPIENILRLINNEQHLIDDTITTDSPFKNLGLRAHLVDDNRLRIFSIDGESIEIVEEENVLGTDYTNFLLTMIDGENAGLYTSNETVSYSAPCSIVDDYIILKSTQVGEESTVEFSQSSSTDAFATVFGYAFTELKTSWKSFGIVGATLIVDPTSSSYGTIVIENMTPYSRVSKLYLNYVLSDSFEIEVPEIYMLEGSVFDNDDNFIHESSNINVKITSAVVSDKLFENIESLPFSYTLKGDIEGVSLINSLDVTNKKISMFISIKDQQTSLFDINFTPGSMSAEEIVNFLNSAVQTKFTEIGFTTTYNPFYLKLVDAATSKVCVRNYDPESTSFIYFYGFTDLENPVPNVGNLFGEIFNISDFESILVEGTDVVLGILNSGDYYITYGTKDSDGKRSVFIVKNHSIKDNISLAPDGTVYLHFINDKSNAEIQTDEKYYEEFLDRYKIACVQNRFMTPSVIPVDIVGKVVVDKKATKSIVETNVENTLRENLKLGALNFGDKMLKSYVESLIYGVSGVRYANLSYIGIDYTDNSTNKAFTEEGGVVADFDELLVIADDFVENNIQKHGIILEYSNVY